MSWWKEELPSNEEYVTAKMNLDAHGWKVDYIITHCCPTMISYAIDEGSRKTDHLTDFLQEVDERCEFRYWFFGHYHENKRVTDKHILLYKDILYLDSIETVKIN